MSFKEAETMNTPPNPITPKMVEEDRHISFSFNVDFDNSDSCDSADSETANLKIDVSEVSDTAPPNKRKRLTDEETNVLNEMEEEIERQLDAKAAKTNLTPINVKNILKHVISDESVRAMVQRQLKNSTDDLIFEPKLTRSKAKELAISQPNLIPLSPVTKQQSEVQALIETELSEDSSDEEYDPESEEQSDDERETENSVGSDMDSLPSTPQPTSEPAVTVDEPKSPTVKYDDDGVFKIPGTPPPLLVDEEESIGQRTRSKLSLSETPLEYIEQAFIPPDITTDMYDWDVDCIDPEYKQFLTEYMKPLNQDPIVDDDPEADPEYNFMEDIETDMVDKEEFREDRGVEISRKELNDLMRSLYDFGDTNLKKEQEAKKKKKTTDSFIASNENSVMNNIPIDPEPITLESEEQKVVTREQRLLLQVQLEQHVQMLTQTFLTTYKHPEYHSISLNIKAHIDSFKYLSSGPDSAFNIRNLEDAEETITNWQNKLSNPSFLNEYTKMVNAEILAETVHVKRKLSYNPRFHPELKATFLESKALLYPHLLPHTFPRLKGKAWNKFPYFNSEENLIVLGMEKYYPIILKKETKFKRKTDILSDVIQQVQRNLLPTRDFSSLLNYVKKSSKNKENSLIRLFVEKGIVPRTIHKIAFDAEYNPAHNTAPKDQPIEFLPEIWKNTSDEEDHCKRHNLRKIIKENIRSGLSNQVPVNPTTNRPVSIVISVPSQEETFKVIISDATLDPVGVPPPESEPEPEPEPEQTPPEPTYENNNIIRHYPVKIETQHADEFILPDPLEEEEPQTPEFNIKIENKFSLAEMEDQTISPDSNSPIKIDMINGILMSPSESSNSQVEENETMLAEPGKNFDEKNDEGYKLRKTTPRLAKIRSAENMKIMAQVLGPKGGVSSTCSSAKNKSKQDSSKTDDECSSTKGDNEDEIAELMLASTTIKKDTISRKKAKQARELENIKRLVESENDNNHEERAAKYAVSFFQKLQSTLINCDPDTFRSVVNLYLTYCEKVNTLDQLESESESKDMQDTDSTTMSSVATDRCKDKFSDVKDEVAAELYTKVCEKLSAYPELCSDFLLFLSPRQADMIDKSVEYTMLQKMKEFINVAQVYFAKQPSRLVKITQALTSLASDPLCTIESVKDTMSPILKGHPVVMDLFMQVLPNGKPPNCLFAPHMFENLVCPVGPQDKNKVYTEDSAELYENIKLPVSTSHDDPYGGESCKCDCHNTVTDLKPKTPSEHCASCGTKFLNGRIYLQTSEGLRPAKITFPGADEEQLENIARVSLKPTDRIVTTPPTKKRKRNSKSESSDVNTKLNKSSPNKDSDENEKTGSKNRRGAKSPPKLSEHQRKVIKLEPSGSSAPVNVKKTMTSKNVKEKRVERKDDFESQSHSSPLGPNDMSESNFTMVMVKSEFTSESDDNYQSETDNSVIEPRPWTREEDALLLKTVKEAGLHHNTFVTISESLTNRSAQDVQGRCDVLFSLLKKLN